MPITQDEIEGGLIFKVGYRGKWSTDRGRLGTGIGLTDAKHVAESHGGELQIDSRPARSVALPPEHREFYRQPFITTVRFLVPVGRTDRSRGAIA